MTSPISNVREIARAAVGVIIIAGTILVGVIAIVQDSKNVPLVLGVLSTLAASVTSSYFTSKAILESRRQ